MAKRLKQEARALVDELQSGLKLDPVDAHRAAFVVMGINRGWPKARIARWLGISRARVGQRVTKYQRYAAEQSNAFPNMARLLKDAGKAKQDSALSVGFSTTDWDNLDFAIEMLNRLG